MNILCMYKAWEDCIVDEVGDVIEAVKGTFYTVNCEGKFNIKIGRCFITF